MHHATSRTLAITAAAGITLTGCSTALPTETASAPEIPAAGRTELSPASEQGGVRSDNRGHPQGGVLTGSSTTAPIKRVVDGDTVIAAVDGHDQRIRVLGIDTPETVDPNEQVGCYGPEASAFAHEQLDGQTVTLRSDPTQDDTDRYDRALRYVILPDGTNYSVAAAAAGVAEPYVYGHNPVREASAIQNATDQARQQQIGMWGAC